MLRDALSELYKYVADSERVRRRPGRVRLLVIKPPANSRSYGYPFLRRKITLFEHNPGNLYAVGSNHDRLPKTSLDQPRPGTARGREGPGRPWAGPGWLWRRSAAEFRGARVDVVVNGRLRRTGRRRSAETLHGQRQGPAPTTELGDVAKALGHESTTPPPTPRRAAADSCSWRRLRRNGVERWRLHMPRRHSTSGAPWHNVRRSSVAVAGHASVAASWCWSPRVRLTYQCTPA